MRTVTLKATTYSGLQYTRGTRAHSYLDSKLTHEQSIVVSSAYEVQTVAGFYSIQDRSKDSFYIDDIRIENVTYYKCSITDEDFETIAETNAEDKDYYIGEINRKLGGKQYRVKGYFPEQVLEDGKKLPERMDFSAWYDDLSDAKKAVKAAHGTVLPVTETRETVDRKVHCTYSDFLKTALMRENSKGDEKKEYCKVITEREACPAKAEDSESTEPAEPTEK